VNKVLILPIGSTRETRPLTEIESPNIVVIIPVLNEEQSIGLVLDAIPEKLVSQVVVVDNGSTDGTARVASEKGAVVVNEPQRGYGAACLRGIEQARLQQPDIIVFLDGDFSDHPEEMPALIEPIVDRDYDMVIGSRMLGTREPGALPIQSLIGNFMVPRIIRILYGARYTDLGPFRAIRFDRLMDLDMQDRNFGWTVEMQIKAAKWNYKTVDIPVSYRHRIGISKITGTFGGAVKAGFKILWMTFSHVFRAGRRGAQSS
jgi:glycosyltransferase involved in cell wall biosynthesis